MTDNVCGLVGQLYVVSLPLEALAVQVTKSAFFLTWLNFFQFGVPNPSSELSYLASASLIFFLERVVGYVFSG